MLEDPLVIGLVVFENAGVVFFVVRFRPGRVAVVFVRVQGASNTTQTKIKR